MRFFITSEAYKTVSKKMSDAYIQMEPKIKSLFEGHTYGDGVVYWGHICICCPPEVYQSGFFKEIRKYTEKDKDIEFRLRIDYEAMVIAEKKEVFELICKSILNGVDIAENEFKVKDFNFKGFRDDLIDCFTSEGWI